MKDLLEFIIKNIVTDSKEVIITERKEDESTEFIVQVPKEDIGAVIGSGGKTIRAIKTLLSLKSKGENFSLEIKEA